MQLEMQLLARIEKLEAQVKALCEHTGLPYDDGSDGVPAEVVALVREGNKARAIKRYQELTGCDLSTASSVVGTISG